MYYVTVKIQSFATISTQKQKITLMQQMPTMNNFVSSEAYLVCKHIEFAAVYNLRREVVTFTVKVLPALKDKPRYFRLSLHEITSEPRCNLRRLQLDFPRQKYLISWC